MFEKYRRVFGMGASLLGAVAVLMIIIAVVTVFSSPLRLETAAIAVVPTFVMAFAYYVLSRVLEFLLDLAQVMDQQGKQLTDIQRRVEATRRAVQSSPPNGT